MKRRLAALAVLAGVALTAVSCNAQDYSTDPFKPCPKGYVRVQVSHHQPDSWACYQVIH